MGREQSINRHPGFLLFRQWGSGNTGHLHVTGMDDLTSKTASPRERKAMGEWPSGDENEALWSMPTMLALNDAVAHSSRCSTHGIGHLLAPV